MPRYALMLLLSGLLLAVQHDIESKDEVLDRTGQKFITRTDIDLLVTEIVNKLVQSKALQGSDKRIALFRLRNKTKDHLDTRAILNQIGHRILLSKTATIVDRERLEAIAKEQALTQTLSKRRHAIKSGLIAKADFVMDGHISEDSKKRGGKKHVRLFINVKLIDVATSEVVASEEAEVSKLAKRSLFERFGGR